MNIQHQTITTCWQYITQSENHQIKGTINTDLEFEASQPEWEMKRISIRENPTGSVMAVRSCGEGIVLEIMEVEKSSRDLHIKIGQQTKFLGLPLTWVLVNDRYWLHEETRDPHNKITY